MNVESSINEDDAAARLLEDACGVERLAHCERRERTRECEAVANACG